MRRTITFLAVLCAVLTVWSCKELTPEEKVAQARARYSVTLNGFFAQKPEPEPEMEMEMGEQAGEAVAAAAEAVASEEGAEGEGEEEMEPEPEGPRTVNILLDLIVQHDLDEALPGITVDLVLVDPDKNEKAAWKVWVETEGLPEANQKQVTHILEDVEYEEGDAFSVEISRGIPADLGEYREFSGAP